MQFSSPLALLISLFIGSALSTRAKLNQYASMDDCKANRNIVKHDSPHHGYAMIFSHGGINKGGVRGRLGCYEVDGLATVVYLVRGTWGAINGRHFYGSNGAECADVYDYGPLKEGVCLEVGDINSIGFGKLKKHKQDDGNDDEDDGDDEDGDGDDDDDDEPEKPSKKKPSRKKPPKLPGILSGDEGDDDGDDDRPEKGGKKKPPKLPGFLGGDGDGGGMPSFPGMGSD